jgi:hypothetical protein
LGLADQPFASYCGFADPSGGSSDGFALCIGHKDYGRQIVVVDALREIKAPFSPEKRFVMNAEFAELLHRPRARHSDHPQFCRFCSSSITKQTRIRHWSVSSTRFSRQDRMEWGWGCRFAGLSSKPIRAAFGHRQALIKDRYFTPSCRPRSYLPHDHSGVERPAHDFRRPRKFIAYKDQD